MRPDLIAAPLLVLLLAGCAASAAQPVRPRTSTAPAPTRVRPPVQEFHTGTRLNIPGLEGIVGADAGQLTRAFGPPRLDVIEGDARKLQWSGAPCVLDAYLYPPAPGREPQATWLDARRTDGRDVDRVDCVNALKR